jgi:hypothetical protein
LIPNNLIVVAGKYAVESVTIPIFLTK